MVAIRECDLGRVGTWKSVAISINSRSVPQRTRSKNRHQSPL